VLKPEHLIDDGVYNGHGARANEKRCYADKMM